MRRITLALLLFLPAFACGAAKASGGPLGRPGPDSRKGPAAGRGPGAGPCRSLGGVDHRSWAGNQRGATEERHRHGRRTWHSMPGVRSAARDLRTGALQGASGCRRQHGRRNESGRQRGEILAQEDRACTGGNTGPKHASHARHRKTDGPATSNSAATRATSRSPSKITPVPRQRRGSSVVGEADHHAPGRSRGRGRHFVRIESRENRVAFEGRFVKESGEIRGIFEMGPYELPLVLRRARTS